MAKVILEVDQRSVCVGDELLAFKWLSRTGIPGWSSDWLNTGDLNVIAVNDIGISTNGDTGWPWHRWAEGEIEVRVRRSLSRPATTATMDAVAKSVCEDIARDWQDEPSGIERKREVPMTDAQVDRLVDQIRGRPASSYETNEQEMYARIAERQESRGWICGQPRGYAQCIHHGTLFSLDGVCVDCEPIDPLDRMVDGLTVRECLERYTQRNREYADAKYDGKLDAERLWYCPKPTPEYERESKHATGWKLTDAQLAAAKQAWSLELKRKQAEERERERCVVCVDDDRWEP